jgi:hydroxyacylglutathione hydrolase
MDLQTLTSHLGVAALCIASTLSAQHVYPPGEAIEAGALPTSWTTGGPRCMEVPDWRIHEYNEDFYILRESGCTHYEKPFLYLIFGKERAMLMDTGAGETDVARIVSQTILKWQQRKQRTSPIPLVVMHSHGHGDHVAGDKQLQALPNVTLIPATADEVAKAFSISPFPTGAGSIDLGSRKLDVIAIPGHEEASVAVYDKQTGILLTGDTFYPGRLYVRDWPAYAASAQRLADFTSDKTVTHILGAHIEQTNKPFTDYPRGTMFQPEEHDLALHPGQLLEWNDAIKKAKGVPTLIVKRDFTIVPRTPQTPQEIEKARVEYEQFQKAQQARKWDQSKK